MNRRCPAVTRTSSPRGWPTTTVTWRANFRLIEAIRKQVAAILRTLQPEDYQRRGIHSEAGPLTLETLVERATGHIAHHLKFIAEKRQALRT